MIVRAIFVSFISLCLGLAWASFGTGAAQAAPKEYQPHDESALIACSKRYQKRLFSLKFTPAETDADTLRTGFGIWREWGVEENVEIAQDATGAWSLVQVNYAAGATSPSMQDTPVAGTSFYAKAGMNGKRTKACLRYAVYFPEDFDFVRGGKLPGLYGGTDAPSGGARPSGDDGFTMRLMWRKGGDGELYGYFPNMAPDSASGGDQIGTGNWRFKRGVWTYIDLELILNKPDREDGRAHIWINDEPVLMASGIQYRETEKLGVGGLIFSTFFGGKSKRWAPRTDQRLFFKDFEMFGQ